MYKMDPGFSLAQKYQHVMLVDQFLMIAINSILYIFVVTMIVRLGIFLFKQFLDIGKNNRDSEVCTYIQGL